MEEGILQRPRRNWWRDGKTTIEYAQMAPTFIKEHRLWEGFKSYSWFVKGMIIIAVILGFDFLTAIPSFFNGDHQNASGGSFFGIFDSFSIFNLNEYLDGSFKYFILIGIEIIIFHFTRRTMMIVTESHIPTDFKTFIGAQKRMIKVAFFSFLMETFVRIVFNTTLSIFGLSFLEIIALFLIQSYYLGFALVDNYNELYDMTIKQSHRYTFQYAPVALIAGAVMNVLMKIPVIGVIGGPVLCAVIVTLTMHQLANLEESRAWVFVKKPRKNKKYKMKTKR